MTLFLRICAVVVLIGLPLWGQAPAISAGGVLNAADNTREIAPGTMVAIFGQRLATRTLAAAKVPLPTDLDGTTVEIAEGTKPVVRAPLYFVSTGQINLQMPYEITALTVQLRVRTAAGLSAAETVAIAARAPKLFTKSQNGKGEPILLHSKDYSFVSDAAPAVANEYLVLLLTGLGAVSPAVAAGSPGGDNGALGPVNRVTEPVSLLVGGRAVATAFAGLMPGLPGIYQVNFQMPADLAGTAPALVVVVGGKQSQAGVAFALAAITPELAVQTALEAQARGDVAGFAAQLEMDRYGEAAKKDAMGMFGVIQSRAAVTNFQFTHLATAMGDLGTLAAVRAQVRYTLTVNGKSYPEVLGVLAFVQKFGDTWKVLSFEADDLLNQEYYEAGAATAKGVAGRAAAPPDLRTLNQMINAAMQKSYFDQTELGLDITFGVVGKVPGYGDAAANVYQVFDTLKTGKEAVQEYLQYGATQIMTSKVKQVGVGILQIVTEVIPPLDSYTDMMQTTMSQWTYTEEVRRALGEFKKSLRQVATSGLTLQPRLYPAEGFPYPKDVELNRDTTVNHSYAPPLSAVTLAGPGAIGTGLTFMVVGEIRVSQSADIAPAALLLGGQLRGDSYYIPVDVGSMVDTENNSGDLILEGFGRYRRAKSQSRVVRWDTTCRRGAQTVSVVLSNGERSGAFRLLNRFMNNVNDLMVPGMGSDGIKLTAGESRTGLQVMGVSATGGMFDLTNQTACLGMSIGSPAVASMTRSQAVTVKGVAAGRTSWKNTLVGSPAVGVADVVREIPVEVGNAVPVLKRVAASLTGMMCTTTRYDAQGKVTGTSTGECFSYFTNNPNWTNIVGYRPLVWSGKSFTASGRVTGVNGKDYWDIDISGDLDATSTTVVRARFAVSTHAESTASVLDFKEEFSVSNVPFLGYEHDGFNVHFGLSGTAVNGHVSGVSASGTQKFPNGNLFVFAYDGGKLNWAGPAGAVSVGFSTGCFGGC